MRTDEIKTSIIVNNYNGYLNAVDPKGHPYLVADGANNDSNVPRQQAIIDKIVYMANVLNKNGKKVVLFGAFYGNEKFGARYFLRVLLHHRDARDWMHVDIKEFDQATHVLNERLQALENPNIVFVDPHDIFFVGSDTSGICKYIDEYPLLADDGHFSTWGADKVARAMRTALEAVRTY